MVELLLPLLWTFSLGYGWLVGRRNVKLPDHQALSVWLWLRNHEHQAFFCPCNNKELEHSGTAIKREGISMGYLQNIFDVYHRLLNTSLAPNQLLPASGLPSSPELKAPRDAERCSPWVCSSPLSPPLLKICAVCLICICLASSLSHWLLFWLSLID